jgi:hypothetical protein
MVKLVMAIRRREDLRNEEFHRYWRDEHGPQARFIDFARSSIFLTEEHAVIDG